MSGERPIWKRDQVAPYTPEHAARLSVAFRELADAYNAAGELDKAAECRRDARWFDLIAKGDPDPPR